MAKENNPLGYNLKFCLVCEVTPIGQEPIKFEKDEINVSQIPLDCSLSLV